MILFYKTGIFFYAFFARISSLFNEKARLFVKGRKNWRNTLSEKVDSSARYIWMHCASLGEFEQGRPLIEEVKKQFPDYKIVLTFFSPSGFEIRKNYELADIVMYLPLDTKRNAKDFLNLLKPEKVFFVKYEFWHFYISELKKRNIPLFIVSAIFRENQQFFKNTPWGKWYRKMLFKVEHIFVQSEASAKLLKMAGVDNFSISGDTRFDRVASIAKGFRNFPIVEKFKGNLPLIVAGSTWKPDEELLVEFINQNSEAKMVFAPHEVSEVNINRLIQMLKKPVARFSQIKNSEVENLQVIVIDSIGILSSIYKYGNIAYIGGGFGVGIHNILEAATFGLPVIFGPNHQRFKEAVDLKSEGGAFSINDFYQLKTIMDSLLNDDEALKKASKISKNYVAKNIGSTSLIIKKVFK
ncbi:3-deoxy-D-manno-octulosonic acid transferase [Maribellus comscasis]|uniref:3-deoxy-D-manno-octulosonic acid transferase n=1 Tax=Maribellus comscasis TaxID=2681766 RepID=A0A6I6JNJ8_9BACT|nr:glycosyltransferase N-terminal domain-containing protein [Maribellus comscasis]QGY44021.1 3-deoxy-D-manno-octulosonic acid transferase [Maribellus comscasis]